MRIKKLSTAKQKKALRRSASARGNRYAKRLVLRRASGALTYMQREATKLKLGRLLTLKKLLRTNQFDRLEQLGALTDLGEHSSLGSLQQLSALGLLTKDLKQTLLLKLAAGIRVAARCCTDSSGRKLLRQYAVVTRKQQRVLFARKGVANTAGSTGTLPRARRTLSGRPSAKSSLANLEALYNLQKTKKLQSVNDDLILTGAKHPVEIYNKLRRLVVERSFDDFNAPVLSKTASVKLQKSHHKLATQYNTLIRAGKRPLNLRKAVAALAEDLQASKEAQSDINYLHKRLYTHQLSAKASARRVSRNAVQRYTGRARAKRGSTVRTPVTQQGSRYTPYKRTAQTGVTNFHMPIRYSLPLSKISSDYTGTVRPVSVQQL